MTTKSKTTDTTPAATAAIAEGQEIMTKGFEKTLEAMKDGMEKAAKGIGTQQARMKEQVAKMMKSTEEFVAFGQGNVEAMVKAGQIFATGMQDLTKHLAATTQASVEDSVATAKALAGVKSVKEAVDLQTSYTRSIVEKMVAETGKLTDESLKLTEKSIAPITARVALAVETFGAKF